MKTKLVLFIAVAAVLSLILLSSPAFACISAPHIETRNNFTMQIPIPGFASPTGKNTFYEYQVNKIFFGLDEYRNETLVIKRLNSLKEACNFSASDISILTAFITNGYSVKEQNSTEYSAFLQQVEQANQKRHADCQAYLAVSKKEKWTGYIQSGLDYDEKSGACSASKCSGAIANLLWNDLSASKSPYSAKYIIGIISAIAVITAAAAILIILKRKKAAKKK